MSLKEAIKEAGLDDPSLLQSYPRASPQEVGLCESIAVLGTSSIGAAV